MYGGRRPLLVPQKLCPCRQAMTTKLLNFGYQLTEEARPFARGPFCSFIFSIHPFTVHVDGSFLWLFLVRTLGHIQKRDGFYLEDNTFLRKHILKNNKYG